MSKNPKSLLIVVVQVFSFLLIFLTGPFFARNNFLFFIELIAIFLGVWALGELSLNNAYRITPEPSNKLITTGPYQYLRNPVYTSIILISLILIIDYFTVIRLIAFIALVIDLFVKMDIEEKYLVSKFKDKFRSYKKKTKKLIPFIY